MAEEPKKNKNNIEKTGIGWYDRARERVQSRARMGTKYRPESMWAGRLIPRQDGDISMDVLRESNPRLFNSNQPQNQSQARVLLSSPNPSTSSATPGGSAATPRSSSGSSNPKSKAKSSSQSSRSGVQRSLSQDMLNRLNEAMSYDRWATGPNDSALRGVSANRINLAGPSMPDSPSLSALNAGVVPFGTDANRPRFSGTGSLLNFPTSDQVAGFLSDPNVSRLGSNLVDAASSVFANMRAARTRIPTFEPSQSFRDYQSRLTAASNVGLTAAEQSAMQSSIDRSAAMGLDSVSRFAGASGSSGAALGAIGRVATGASSAMANMAMQDQSIANQNLARLGQFEAMNRNMDFNQRFIQERDQAIADKNQFASAALLNRRQISDRNDYYRTYEDPNSPYQLMEAEKRKTQDAITRSITDLENRPLDFSTITTLTGGADDTKNEVSRSQRMSESLVNAIFQRKPARSSKSRIGL